MSIRFLLVVVLAPLLAACTSAPGLRLVPADPAHRACLEWFDRLDAVVAAAGVADAQEARIPASAGQMRQWGRHATAFVGRRHFDDADLFEKRFVLDLSDRHPPSSD